MSRAVVHAIATLAVAGIVATLVGPTLLTEVEAHREYGAFHGLAPAEVVIDRAGDRVPTGVFALAVVAVEPGSVVLDPPPALARLLLAQEELFGSHPVDSLAEDARMSAWMAAQETTGSTVTSGFRLVGDVNPPLRQGDIIITINGRPVTRQLLGGTATDPGACLGVLRDGAPVVVDVPLGYDVGPAVRVERTPASVEVPFVEGLEGYEGASAGLALALAYLQVLSGVDVTAGRRIGATGILEASPTPGSWRISAVGSAGVKAAAAARAGLDAVIVPAANEAEARAAVGGTGCRTQVVAVATMDAAVRWLAGHADSISAIG